MSECIDTKEKAEKAVNELLNYIDSAMLKFRMIGEDRDICLLELSYFDCCFIKHCIEKHIEEVNK